MYSKIVFLLILFAFIANFVFAQNKETAIWHVGNKCINFNTTPATVSETQSPFLGKKGGAEISDENGNLLFFYSTQDSTIYDKNYHALPNGKGVSEGTFVPIPNSKYYYFINKRYYTIIDTQLNNACGEVTTKNIRWNKIGLTILTNSYLIRHRNCKEYWFVFLGQAGINSFLINENGIDSIPVVSPERHYINDNFYLNNLGQCITTNYSNSGTSINYGIFDTNTGKFNKLISYLSTYFDINAICFSPDNTKLYYTAEQTNYSLTDFVQVNMTNSLPDFEHQVILDRRNYPILAPEGTMQCGLDGKLYKCYIHWNKIDIIHRPNELGTACNLESGAILLNTSDSDIPNFSAFTSCECCAPFIQVFNFCSNQTTFFRLSNTKNIQSTTWNFGDSSTSNELNPSHTYTNSGTYTVQVSVNYADGTSQTLTKTIIIHDKPSQLRIIHN